MVKEIPTGQQEGKESSNLIKFPSCHHLLEALLIILLPFIAFDLLLSLLLWPDTLSFDIKLLVSFLAIIICFCFSLAF